MSFEKLAVLKNQMEVDAKTKADEAKKVANAQKVDPVVYTIARLQRLFPKAFPKSPLPKIPLKLGILKDLLARSDEIKISHDDLKLALQKWCRSHRYWSASTEGAPRIDLDGNANGAVSDTEAAQANALLNRQKKRPPRAS